MTDTACRTVVIGLGNPLMGDDGAGLAALEELRRCWDISSEVELIDGGTWGMNLLPLIEDADELLFLDAVHSGSTPGTVVSLVGAAVPRSLEQKMSPHQIDLREVIALAALRGTLPRELIVIGVEPEQVEMGLALSEAVDASIPLMLARAATWLEALGHRCSRVAPLACTS